MIDPQILTFIGFAAILTLIPGPDTFLVIRSVLARGARSGLLTTFGICFGLFVHASLSGAGLSLILVHSATAYSVVKIAGACYLMYLGFQSLGKLFRQRHIRQGDFAALTAGLPRKAAWRSFFEGMLNNVLNPKAAIFYLAVLPQFIRPGDPVFRQSLLLASIHFAMGIAWLSLVALFVGRMRAFITNVRVQRRLEAASGLVLVGFGARLVLERR